MSSDPFEKNVSTAIVNRLNKLPGCKVKKRFTGVMGNSEVDIYGCYWGRAVFMEVKRRPGMPPSKRQASMLRQWSAVGAITGTVGSPDEAEEILLNSKTMRDLL